MGTLRELAHWRTLRQDFFGCGPGASQVPLSLVTIVFGPRYRWSMTSKARDFSIFGESLVGDTGVVFRPVQITA